jgi:hypothetical protein
LGISNLFLDSLGLFFSLLRSHKTESHLPLHVLSLDEGLGDGTSAWSSFNSASSEIS